MVDWVLDYFLGAEGDVSGRVEVGRPFVESAFAGSPSVNFGNLGKKIGYGGELLVFRALDDSTERRHYIDVDAAVGTEGVLERHQSDL